MTPLVEHQIPAMVQEWRDLTKWLEQAKVRELELRKLLGGHLLRDKVTPSGALPEGTVKAAGTVAGIGYSVSASTAYEREIIVDEMAVALSKANLTPEQADALVRKKFELAKREYDKLTDAQKKCIDTMLVVKPKSSSFSLAFSR